MSPGTGLAYRLVLDLQATQNPAHAHRGIGRYVKEHARALIAQGAVDALVLNPHLPFPRQLDRDLLCSPLLRWNTMSEVRAVAGSASGPLAYHLMSPFELGAHAEGEVPAHLVGEVPLVVTLYDLIPLVDPDRYAGDPERMRRYRVRAGLLERADLVLAISEHTARTAREHLGLDPDRVVTIGAGVSPFFGPAGPGDDPVDLLASDLPAIDRPFALAVAGAEPRKNTERLLEAWAALPADVRDAHRLVLACQVDEPTQQAWSAHGRAVGLADGEVVCTGWVSDEILRALYRRARALVLPSLAEGFGLPAAEALACGCPAITSSTSSLPEVLAWPPATFDPTDTAAMAAAVARVLVDDDHRAALLARAGERAGEHTWTRVAERSLGALSALAPPPVARTELPVRLALVGPMPPTPSGIADYNARLVPHLARRCQLDVFTPSPRPPATAPGVRWFPPLALSRNLSPWSYDAVVYTIGNSDDHHDLYEQAEEFPGLLWMHDVRLSGLYLSYARARRSGDGARDFLRSRLVGQYRRRLPPGLALDIEDEPEDYVESGLGMSQELVEHHRGVIVSNQVAQRLLILDQQPDARAVPSWVVPLAVPEPSPAPPPDGTGTTGEAVVASFGMVAPSKAPSLVVRAFAAARRRVGARPARLVFVGEVSDANRAALQALADAGGAGDHVSFTGLCPREDYDAWMGRAAVAVQLRRTTTGESSGALQECIATGVPVVTNVASAGELPSGVVDLVSHEVEVEELAAAIARNLSDAGHVARQRQAQAAHARSWGYAQVAERLLEIVRSLAPHRT
ncbi:MAG TPA: glycosyltransferase [Acidimicrobiales bacterium]|nr:glycosyltransferase [Acidimicrobiales bacterium]